MATATSMGIKRLSFTILPWASQGDLRWTGGRFESGPITSVRVHRRRVPYPNFQAVVREVEEAVLGPNDTALPVYAGGSQPARCTLMRQSGTFDSECSRNSKRMVKETLLHRYVRPNGPCAQCSSARKTTLRTQHGTAEPSLLRHARSRRERCACPASDQSSVLDTPPPSEPRRSTGVESVEMQSKAWDERIGSALTSRRVEGRRAPSRPRTHSRLYAIVEEATARLGIKAVFQIDHTVGVRSTKRVSHRCVSDHPTRYCRVSQPRSGCAHKVPGHSGHRDGLIAPRLRSLGRASSPRQNGGCRRKRERTIGGERCTERLIERGRTSRIADALPAA